MSAALTGPASHLGLNMRAGIQAALEEKNNGGGIRGRKLCLIALDDGYEPARVVPNMHDLINKYNVLAVIGNVGTPTAVAAIPLANRYKIPFYGAFTGAGILRKTPPDRYVINYRASYAEETAAMVEALINKGGLTPREIAFFTQRDAYGDAGFVAGIQALKQHGLQDESSIAHGRYERNTMAVENGLANIMLANPSPRAVIMVAAYGPSAAFIKLARKYDFDSLFLSVSFVGTEPLTRELGIDANNIIVTQVVPHLSFDLPIVMDFRNAIRQITLPDAISFGALEGYISARIFLRALETIRSEPDRESVIDALEGLGEFDIGLGQLLYLNKDDHQASHGVWPTIIRNGRIDPFRWEELTQMLKSR